MKRIILLFSALMLSCIALWAHDVEIGGIYYNLNETKKTAEVTYYGDDDYNNEYSGSVTIPETITYNSQTYRVTSIGSSAFLNCSGLTEVTIPNSVTSIGSNAFSRCSGLTKVNYLGTVDKWVEIDFVNTSNPTYHAKDLYINNELLTDVKITSADSIKNSAFYNCQSIKSVEIGNSVTSIGWTAFLNCSGLTEVIIPNSVTSIGKSAFFGCRGLKNIIISSDNLSYTSEDGVLFNKDKTILLKYPEGKENTSYIIPNTVTEIGNNAFYRCSGLTSITIPNSVTSIGYEAFQSWSGLTSITIPNSVTSIGERAFIGCRGLTSVTLPNSASIGYDAFYNTGIYKDESNWDNGVLYIDNCLIKAKSDVVKGSYTIKKGTRIIGDYAFSECSGLTEVIIPNSVTFIGWAAFSYCSGLTSVTIGNSVTSIGYAAFYDCSGLTSVIWNAKNCADFEWYDKTPFYDSRSSITSFTFGNEVEHIPAYLCYGMSKLTEITIPNSVTSIGSGAFSGCSGLTEITIPNSVTSIGQYAFSGCDKLIKVTAYPTTVPNVYNGHSFAHYNAALYVPCDVYDDYFFDDVFGTFKVIECIAGEEDEPVSITETLADANITVSGGTISAEADFSIYNTIGQDVTAFNGSLQPGIYLVSIENNIVKVMVH